MLTMAKNYEQKHVWAMMTESEDATFVPTKDNPAIWESKGQNFLKIIRQLTGGTTDTIINF